MRILHVTASLDPKTGGPAENIRQLACALKARGASVVVACCDKPSDPWVATPEESFAEVHAFGPGKGGLYRYAPNLLPWLREQVGHFDAVTVDGVWQYNCLAASLAFAGTKTPYFVFPHGSLSPWFKRAYPLKHLKKWLYWPWASYGALKKAAAVLFTCEEERREARESFWLYRVNEAIVPCGITTPPQDAQTLAATFLDAYPELKDKRIVLFVGRIHGIKGCDLLAQAFSSVAGQDPNLRLVMVGPDQEALKEKINLLLSNQGYADRVVWTGLLRDRMKWGAYYAADVFCLPSHHENFGIVVAEALACGKPVLISDKVNIWREIKADGAGFVASDTAEGTKESLQKWLSLSPQDYQTMSQQARNTFAARYHINASAQMFLDLVRAHVGADSKDREEQQ